MLTRRQTIEERNYWSDARVSASERVERLERVDERTMTAEFLEDDSSECEITRVDFDDGSWCLASNTFEYEEAERITGRKASRRWTTIHAWDDEAEAGYGAEPILPVGTKFCTSDGTLTIWTDGGTIEAAVGITRASDDDVPPDIRPRPGYALVNLKFEVCDLCDGRGKHTNPSIDAGGISVEDFDEDPDFREDYLSGVYDVPCNRCGGKRVVPAVDRDNNPEELLARIDGQEREDAEFAAEQRAERMWGA